MDPYDIGLFIPVKPEAEQVLYARRMVRQITLPANLDGSRGGARVAPSGTYTVSIRKNGTQFATGTISAGSTAMSFGASAETAFAVGDKLTVIAPSTEDAALWGLDMTLAGMR